MKRLFLAGLLAAAFISTPAMAGKDKIAMPNELRAKISAYIGQKKVTSVTLKSPAKRGRKFEDSAALLNVPAEWGPDLAKYKYVYSGNRVLFIDPDSHKLVDTIKVTP